jgi:pentapeptide repeat protein
MEVKELKLNRIGYKGFNVKEDGTLYCRDMTFKVGDMAEVKGPLVICKNGIHFCWNLNDVNDYYNLRDSVICEVEPLGEIVADIDGKKCCTNKLKIKRMLTKEEVLKISNTGNENTGYINSGDCNSGDCNSGNCNSGFFNENENKCYIFDKLSDMTVLQFRNSRFYEALNSVPFILTEWVEYTEEEKKADKAKALIGGYLKKYEYKEACKTWWDKLSDKNKKIIQEIPNFDAEKFYRITGIRI